MERLKQQLQAEGIAYRADEPLAAHCTFKIGGPADVFGNILDPGVQPGYGGVFHGAYLIL